MLRFIALCGCLLLTAGFACAEWTEVQSLQAGEPIQVRAGFVTDAGKFVTATVDSVVVETRAGQVTIQKGDIDEVLVFRSRSRRIKKGLLWGGVGAAATAAVFFPLASRLAKPEYGYAAAITGVNGVALGLGGASGRRTDRMYRRMK